MNRELDLRALMAMLSRQALFVAATVALVIVAAFVALASVPNTYEASAVLEIDTVRRDPLGRIVGGENAGADNTRVENEVEVVLTDAVLLDVVESERLFEDRNSRRGPVWPEDFSAAFAAAGPSRTARRRSPPRPNGFATLSKHKGSV